MTVALTGHLCSGHSAQPVSGHTKRSVQAVSLAAWITPWGVQTSDLTSHHPGQGLGAWHREDPQRVLATWHVHTRFWGVGLVSLPETMLTDAHRTQVDPGEDVYVACSQASYVPLGSWKPAPTHIWTENKPLSQPQELPSRGQPMVLPPPPCLGLVRLLCVLN